MSKYVLQINVDGVPTDEWFDLTITSVGVIMESDCVDHHVLEEFLTDLMIDGVATASSWSGPHNTIHYGREEF